MSVGQQAGVDGLVRKAVNLFTFLGRTQQLMLTPVRTVDGFEDVVWFSDLPVHPAVRGRHTAANLEAEEPLLEVDRVPRLDAPAIPTLLIEWVSGSLDDTDKPPALRDEIFTDEPEKWLEASDEGDDSSEDDDDRRRVLLTEAVGVSEAFEQWLPVWQAWADREREDVVARDLYKELFALYLKSTDHSEEFELVVGVGCLAWRPDSHDQVLRHVATAQIGIGFDEATGRLSIRQLPSPQSLVVEINDMLEPHLIPSPAAIDEIRNAASEYSAHVLDVAAVGELCRRLIFRLDPDASYDDTLEPPKGVEPRGAFAPALILRRRTNRGLVQIYEQIVAQILASNEVPSGVLPLIDPDQQPTTEVYDAPGAVVRIDEEDFLPLPVNEQQRRIIDRVDATAQTVVQGPPGTGKTHTAAALVSHLLAQGKRVLITAHADRALREVRAKLPREIQSLAVSVIGQSRSDMAELRTAVENISSRADEFEPADSARTVKQYVENLDFLRRQRAENYARLLAVRRLEIEPRTDGPAEGTLASIAYRNLQDEPRHEWIRAFDVEARTGVVTASNEEIARWRAVLLDRDVIEHEPESAAGLPSLALVPTSDAFTAMVLREQEATSARERFGDLLQHKSFDFVRSLGIELRAELHGRVSALAERAASLEQRHETWMNEALRDVRSGRQQTWLNRSHQLKILAHNAYGFTSRIGPTVTVAVAGDTSLQQQVAKTLMAYLQSGGKIKVQVDGTPKLGAFTPKAVKQSDSFFRDVKVNGVPPTTVEQLAVVIDWVEARRTIDAMDQAWPVSVDIPQEDTHAEQLQWHRTEVDQLDKVLALGEQIEIERSWFQHNGLPVPNWNDLEEIRRYRTFVEAAAASDEVAAASRTIEQSIEAVCDGRPRPNLVPITANIVRAMSERDLHEFNGLRSRLEHLHRVGDAVGERNRIGAILAQSAPALSAAISADPDNSDWDSRIASYDEAWRWELTRRWVLAQDDDDVNALKLRLSDIDHRIRKEVERLAAERAWAHAVAPGRLTGSARANLKQYAQLVASLGKGTGKYAAKKRVEIADAMDRCRPSVPVWIMPIYRIAEQVRVQPNLYDVVIVDEASQAGLEATFLQYLAPKIVVIGDDKQVSPSAVGVDQQQLRDLANQFLATDRFRASWLDPKRSYFDEASMRFGGRITLVEHRRCVPEIIGFSNRVAYEPEGIKLIPVRQFGAERLDPIRVVHVTDGYETNNKTNPAEADAIVEQIQKCLVDREYDGKTFGVISLLGDQQARLVEHKLLDAVSPDEWAARELRCGDASDFQGSERDVMFISIVKAMSEGKRLMPLTASQYVQRFNVAASRAKDQMWVYHSMAREDLTNTEDMRYQLLDYCYGVANRKRSSEEGTALGVVPEDVLVSPFDSLFEQRVYNRIFDRGYTVHAQYPTQGYNIDMVIIGAKGKLAVECDGDFWHGPDVYEADLARQRELERCDWRFFRIRESVFYADMPGSLQKLWDRLDELDIRTADWIDPKNDQNADEGDDLTGGAGEDAEVIDGDDDSSADRDARSGDEAIDTGGGESLVDDVSSLSTDDERAFSEASETQSNWLDDAPPSAGGEGERDALDYASTSNSEDLQEYVSFDDRLPKIIDSRLDTISTNVARIVEVEGPVLGERIHLVYAKSAGENATAKKVAHILDQAITSAERRGMIMSDNPLQEAGVKTRTFRLSTQPEVLVRELGPRSLPLVPPAEIAQHLREASNGGGRTEDEVFRTVLDRLGIEQHTVNSRTTLARAQSLVPLPENLIEADPSPSIS